MDFQSGFRIGDFTVEPRNGRILKAGISIETEPKVLDLLCLLARHAGETVTRDDIADALWAGQIVNDDALARTVWKLRRALDDDARNPRFIATIPKRGYRLLVPAETLAAIEAERPVSRSLRLAGGLAGVLAASVLIALVWFWMKPGDPPDQDIALLIDRADDFYAQMTQAENAAAMRLYEQVIEMDAQATEAHAGLSNALVQTVVRWSPGEWAEFGENSRIQTALANGRTLTPDAQRRLAQALIHARLALEIDPGYALGYRALGLALSANGEIDAAIEAYNRAVTIDPDSWEAFINLSDLHEYKGEPELQLSYLERAHAAMTRVYDAQAVRIRPWYSNTGLLIVAAHLERGDDRMAERWLGRVLQWDPLNAEALGHLAGIYLRRGERVRAQEACAVLVDATAFDQCLDR